MKKEIIAISVAAAVLIGLFVFIGISPGETKVRFKNVPEKMLPREIETEILPEYRDIERALACKTEDKVYVIVTRGEKPTAGYEVEIEKISLESRDDKTKLVVYADFADPDNGENLAQVKSYSYAVAETDLTGLPDSIELKASYID